MTEISPAILTNDISDFRKKYAELFALHQYFKTLHVDFIDGQFLPNKTIMPGDDCRVKAPFKVTAHLMMLKPQNYFAILKNQGFNEVLIQFEAFDDKAEILKAIELTETLNLSIGLVINPETKLHNVGNLLSKFKIIQLMAIHPGSQGQAFILETLDKIRELRSLSASVKIYVDGGIKIGIAKKCAKAGADILVAGSAILKAENEELSIESLLADIET